MIKHLLNSVLAKYRISLQATDKSQSDFAQPYLIIDNYYFCGAIHISDFFAI